ncbi:hypothetical protein E1B28_001473 [Marasmius oreades]|uniref:F-box domain-containing protein n=1 Tax=Marasmius oreades TaxID=181124 RepID=A0A9P7V3L8_9AGAR|nr:uncharacterized protein E1B28_001473 [Marasmius oreades]KAG7099647.1 hypothetical protein E1B28_001473 [Marasmius oreades]
MAPKITSLNEFLVELPAEVVLHIFTYLDLPDLALLSKISPRLASIASDPALHKTRLRIIAPSRVQHSLFAQGPQGITLRPTIPDLVRRGVVRGLGIERRWRDGSYFYSQRSIVLYEASIKLSRRHAGHAVSTVLRERQRHLAQAMASSNLNVIQIRTLQATHGHVLPDVEFSSTQISRLLLPVMHKLKWSFQRDRLARVIREKGQVSGEVAKWINEKGKGILQEGERVRLALCPDMRRKVGIFESLRR